jgi:hypothetical protein
VHTSQGVTTQKYFIPAHPLFSLHLDTGFWKIVRVPQIS